MTVEMYDRCWAAVPDCLRQVDIYRCPVADSRRAGPVHRGWWRAPVAARVAGTGAGARQPLPALVPETVAGAPVAGVRLSV